MLFRKQLLSPTYRVRKTHPILAQERSFFFLDIYFSHFSFFPFLTSSNIQDFGYDVESIEQELREAANKSDKADEMRKMQRFSFVSIDKLMAMNEKLAGGTGQGGW